MLINNEALELEIEYNARLYNEAIKSLASLATSFSDNVNINSVLPLLAEFKNIRPLGRIKTEFDISKLSANPKKDILLSHGDKIFIPYKKNVVHVFGEVLNPGSQSFVAGQTISDYINASGGLNNSADRNSIILVHANGQAERIKFKRNIFGKSDPEIYQGSVIYITRDLDDVNSLKLFSTIAPIVSSLAISLASLNSISNS